MSFREERNAETREKRLSTLSSFDGSLEGLIEETEGTEIHQKIRTFSQVYGDEVGYALHVLSRIEGAAVVVHGVAGCAASGLWNDQRQHFPWYSTNLNERDTILGGDEKLRRAVQRAYEEQNPDVIFIVGTPVVAINNDDVRSVIFELSDELAIPLIHVPTDGFKSKTPLTGYDLVSFALLKFIAGRTALENENISPAVNVVTYSESKSNVASVLRIFADLGIPYRLLPRFADIESIADAAHAAATVVLNPDEGGYFAEQLEEEFGVPYVRAGVPAGLRGTEKFIRAVVKALEKKEGSQGVGTPLAVRAEAYIAEKRGSLESVIRRAPIVGSSVFLDTDLESAVGLTRLIEKLGGSIEALAIPCVDLENRGLLRRLSGVRKGTQVFVGEGQPYERANIIARKHIDYYISTRGYSFFADIEGTVPVSFQNDVWLGYEGVREIVRRLETAKAFVRPRSGSIYKKSWLRKSSGWFVKREVS